jgi:hypothetical protein
MAPLMARFAGHGNDVGMHVCSSVARQRARQIHINVGEAKQ